MRFLGFEIRKRPGADGQPIKNDLPPKEEPMGVSATGSLLNTTPPTGTRFNRKVIISITAVIVLISFFAMLHALQPKKHLTPQEIAEAAELDGKKDDSKVYLQKTPDSVTAVPGKYSEIAKFEEENRLKAQRLKDTQQGTVSGQIGSVKDVSNDAVKSYNSGTPSNARANDNINSVNAGHGQVDRREAEIEKELQAARKSPIGFSLGQTSQSRSQPKSEDKGADSVKQAIGSREALISEVLAGSGAGMGGGNKDDQNLQTEKRKFIKDQKESKDKDAYLKYSLMKAISPYEVKAGSIIPGVLITGINSDLPGGIVGQVRENVYDTVTGQHLLIPQGTRVIGEYDSKVAYAQERVLIVWTRMIFPNGDSINLEGMNGVDMSGYSGLSDQVNNHFAKLLLGVILSTTLSTSAKIAAGNYDSGTADYGQLAVSGAAEEINKVGSKIVEKNLNVQPTLEIRPGFKFNVFVNKDMILRPYKS
ncbi:MAG: TrbI/VirB10 family protein [Deltaproteobacteria bacterium]